VWSAPGLFMPDLNLNVKPVWFDWQFRSITIADANAKDYFWFILMFRRSANPNEW
jgi:hypothetical protein